MTPILSFWPFETTPKANYTLITEPSASPKVHKDIKSFLKTETKKIKRNTRLYLEKTGKKIQEKLIVDLKMKGYLNPKVTTKLTRKKPYKFTFSVDPGPLYHWRSLKVRGIPRELPPYRTGFIRKGKVFKAERLLKTQHTLLEHLQNHGYPKPKITDTRIHLTKDHHVEVMLTLKRGVKANFGNIQIKGNVRAEKNWILKQLKYQKGELFSEKKIEKTQKKLIKTEVFDHAHIDKKIVENKVETEINVNEAKPRFIGGSANLSNRNGFEFKAFWGHRNLFGNGESLKIDGKLGKVDQSARMLLKFPSFLRSKEDLLIKTLLKKEDTPAYHLKTYEQSFLFDRNLSKHFDLLYGSSLNLERNRSYFNSTRFTLLSFPLTLKRKTTNSSFDPYDGSMQKAFIEPHVGWRKKIDKSKEFSHFFKTTFESEHFFSLYDRDHFVGAARFKGGHIFGENLSRIPQSRRFYSGGGKSVRGYGFQKISPYTLSDDGKKVIFTGGRTLLETNLEARYKIDESIGIVPFVDIGYVSNHKKNEARSNLLVGTGIGGRYYIDKIGPIRADIAIPTKRRKVLINKGTYFKKKRIDDFIQFYINIGHTF